tara:strand:+ start:167 stop:436 length:270 start_codon:yes stop_codon:yes gene_type:complete
MKDPTIFEFNAMRRRINDERTPEKTRTSYIQILEQFNEPLTIKESISEEEEETKATIEMLKETLEFQEGEDREETENIIKELEMALEFM